MMKPLNNTMNNPRRIFLFTLLCASLFMFASLVQRLWSLSTSSFFPSSLMLNDDGSQELLGDVLRGKKQKQQQKEEEDQQKQKQPEIAWLLSFPNSGTSYTLTLVEVTSNRSIASNYGLEFSNEQFPEPISVNPDYPEGPFWEGLESDVRFASRIRPLPHSFVLTKTHCGGRCVKCPASEYLENTTAFLQACKRTSFQTMTLPPPPPSLSFDNDNHQQEQDGRHDNIEFREGIMDEGRVTRAVHLIRNPLDNIVSRFHLKARHRNKKNLKKQQQRQQEQGISKKNNKHNDTGLLLLPMNATGFRIYCQQLDDMFPLHDEEVHFIWNVLFRHHTNDWPAAASASKYRPTNQKEFTNWLQQIPCRSEFVKYAQWHNHILHTVLPVLGPTDSSTTVPVLTIYYEEYGSNNLPHMTRELLTFLELPFVIQKDSDLLPFHNSNYQDHYELYEKKAIARLLRAVSTPDTWRKIRHYVREWL